MKKIKILCLAFLVAFISCTESDDTSDPVSNSITVNVSDFSTTINENPAPNTTLGTLTATTNQGSLTFTVTSQTPANAIEINSSTGEITVLDETLFDFETNPVISGIIKVENSGVSDNANFTITLNDVNENTTTSLKSVTIKRFDNNDNEIHSVKYTFQNDLLIEVKISSNGSVDSALAETYSNGLVKKMKTYLLAETEYFYDNDNRLIKAILTGQDGPIVHEFNYNGDEIEFIGRLFGGGNPSVHYLKLNSDNLIYKELVPGSNDQTFVSTINYQNGNPLTVDMASGTLDEYQYSSQQGSDAYNFYQYIFGEHWKNNLLLESDEFSNLNYRDNVVNYISDNYITQFKRTYSDGSFFGYNITYDFDANSMLTKETRDYFGDPEYNYNPKKVEVLYEYH
ncbi:cadherin repeat domain-containing protein [Mesonia maritima]|uniref:Cadherin domain-containing protein n=1 Tax=Mesonia maritima TaxID=1793873 RepID=A0ABU1K625_9FLAO|nr:cadherin repeat domain-containing protein [Mesonia maritima]MDR6301066.1 hypothetical protein [Mesonia maritima]